MSSIPPAYCVFDIETRPVPSSVERFAKPYPDFDESAVKYGNTKDPVKRADLLAGKRAEHEAERAPYWANLHAKAALDPFTGAVVCIGVLTATGMPHVIAEATEAATLQTFWAYTAENNLALTKFVFWSGCGDPVKKFDLDFLVTRSRILGVTIPPRVREGRYYVSRFVDLAGEFLLHQRERFLSLTRAADLLGLYQEHDDITPKRDDDPVTGENFHQWWDNVAIPDPKTPNEQRLFATRYLVNDLLATRHLAARIL